MSTPDVLPHGPDEVGGPRVTNRESMGAVPPLPDLQVTARDLATLIDLDVSRLDPKFHYRLVHKSRQKVARRRAMGYKVVDPAEEEVYHNSGERLEPAEDGTYSVADLVLMKIPRREHKQRRLAQKRRTEQRLKGPKRAFKNKARRTKDRGGNTVEVITDKEPGRSGRRGR